MDAISVPALKIEDRLAHLLKIALFLRQACVKYVPINLHIAYHMKECVP